MVWVHPQAPGVSSGMNPTIVGMGLIFMDPSFWYIHEKMPGGLKILRVMNSLKMWMKYFCVVLLILS